MSRPRTAAAESQQLATADAIQDCPWQREEFRSHLPRGIRSVVRLASEASSEDTAPKPRTLACFERRKPPLGAVFLVFDQRRALLGAGRGWNLASNHAIRLVTLSNGFVRVVNEMKIHQMKFRQQKCPSILGHGHCIDQNTK
jgi:hypothetical protein